MILANNLNREQFGYAEILLVDYHREYPVTAPNGAIAEIVWNPYELSQIARVLNGDKVPEEKIEAFGQLIFKGLDFDSGASILRLQGSLMQLACIATRLAQALMGGPGGSDDDTFDYWPNTFIMLCELMGDLIRLGAADYFTINPIDAVVKSAIAVKGPADTWEAEGILTAVDELKAIQAEL